MKPVSGPHMCRVLERNGWRLVRINSSHHQFRKAGIPKLITVPVHGNDDLKPGTQRKNMRDAGHTDADL